MKHLLAMASMTCLALTSLSAQAQTTPMFPKTVSALDLPSYMGTWYQIAVTVPDYQGNCACVTSSYTANDDNTIAVTNSCRKGAPDGELDIVNGTMTPTSDPGKLNMKYENFNMPMSNYWVVAVADDYSWAIVTTPLRFPIWVLSRTPTMDDALKWKLYDTARTAGLPAGLLHETRQTGCWQTE